MRALLGAAACLSVGSLGLVTANRRRQLRRRGIGRTSASTPDDLAEVEQAIVEHGAQAQADVEFLDRALRHVAACCQATGSPLPQLGAAVLSTEDLTLLFTRPPLVRYRRTGRRPTTLGHGSLPRQACFERDLESQPAPYPALVSIGHDEGGRTWLLDLEALGSCGIGGEPQQVEDLTRFLVAELAVNAWSEGSEVLLADQFGAETVAMNPSRLRQVERSDALARAVRLTSELGEVEAEPGRRHPHPSPRRAGAGHHLPRRARPLFRRSRRTREVRHRSSRPRAVPRRGRAPRSRSHPPSSSPATGQRSCLGGGSASRSSPSRQRTRRRWRRC